MKGGIRSVIGEGGNGCIFRPALRCKEENFTNNLLN